MNTIGPQHHTVLDFTNKEKVFVVGDIHGEADVLFEKLDEFKFDSNKHVLISTGDLVDRGPKSKDMLSLIQEEWFYRVLGNHEVMPMMFLRGKIDSGKADKWGGGWFVNMSIKELIPIAKILEDAPYCLTVYTPGNRKIGITHGDCLNDWDAHISRLCEQEIRNLTIWKSDSFDTLYQDKKNNIPLDPEKVRVRGVDHVFHGHTMLAHPFTIANRSWIDTGCCMGGDLTILDVDDFLSRKL